MITIIAILLLFLLGGFGMMGYGGFGWMMPGFYGGFGWLFMLLVIIALALFIVWLVKQLQKSGGNNK